MLEESQPPDVILPRSFRATQPRNSPLAGSVALDKNACRSRTTMHRPTVLLAEDHAETAELLRRLLGREFDVVGSVEDGGALVEAAARLCPDAIVTDLAMPGIDGIAATTVICRNDPDARIVLVTVHAEAMLVQSGLAAGALGYLLKDSAGDELVAAVHAALAGRRYVSRRWVAGRRDDARQRFAPRCRSPRRADVAIPLLVESFGRS